MNHLISVVIPVYNVVDYLRACLESVLTQTYESLEIIVVDDGSTDGSLESVQDLVAHDDRIRTFRQTNQGAAAARNKGIDEAKGEYIFFLDADDTLTSDAIACLYDSMQEFSVQVVVGGVGYYDKEGQLTSSSSYPRGLWPTKDVVEMMYGEHVSILLAAGKMLHKDLLTHLRFPVGKLIEDAFFQPALYHLVDYVFLEPRVIYRYQYERPGNASQKASPLKYEHNISALESALSLFGEDDVLRSMIIERSFNKRLRYLEHGALTKNKALLSQVRRTYWKNFLALSISKKCYYFQRYIRWSYFASFWTFVKRFGWFLDKHVVNGIRWRWRATSAYEFLKQRKVINQLDKNVKKRRWPAFLEGVRQIKRVGYYANTVGRYIQVPNVPVCYLDNAKVASTSIKEVLLLANGGSMENLFKRELHMHFSKYFVKERIANAQLPYFTFVFVRNPFERVVSTYKNMYHSGKLWSTFKVYLFGYFQEDKGFDYFVRKGPVQVVDSWSDTHLVSQHVLVYDAKGNSYADFVGRFERLEEDWKVIQEKVSLPDLPIRNQTTKDDWRDYYTLELAEIVYHRYQKDIELFGYEEEYVKLKIYLREKEKKHAGI